jgi:hypothetical protein
MQEHIDDDKGLEQRDPLTGTSNSTYQDWGFQSTIQVQKSSSLLQRRTTCQPVFVNNAQLNRYRFRSTRAGPTYCLNKWRHPMSPT